MSSKKVIGGRRGGQNKWIIILMVSFLLMAIIAGLMGSIGSVKISLPSNIPLKSAEEIAIEEQYGPLAPIVKSFQSLMDTLTGDTGDEVGLEAEVGMTDTSGESIVYSEKLMSGVGFLGMSGIFVKPSLGNYKALKLYDKDRGLEGEIWVKPIIRIRVFNGTPEEWSFHLKTKITADQDIIDIKEQAKSGKGIPPKKIEFDRISVKGSTLHKILRGEVKSLGTLQAAPLQLPTGPRKICFYTDYQGMIKFKDDPDPVVKELKNVKLACFDFEFKETGDFEMITEQNVTVAPLAEVMAGGESGIGGIETITVTHTVTLPYKTYTTTVTSTYVSGGVTYTTTITSISVSYKYYTLTQTKTRWKTTTVTVKAKPVTVTVTKYIQGGGGSVLGNVTVITPDGNKPIQDVRPGDLVLTEEGFREVKEVKVIQVFNLYKIELEDGKVLIADDAQPVITNEGVKRVGELRVGDELQTLDGTARITSIRRHELKAIVYDLIFDKPLNYYANGVLVNDLKSGVILLAWPYSEFIFIG